MIEDYRIVTLATVRGEEEIIDDDYGYGHAICSSGDMEYVHPSEVANLRDAIVLPLPEVTDVPAVRSASAFSNVAGYAWSHSSDDEYLEAAVAKGISAAAVLLHRKAQREATPDLTEDLRTLLVSISKTNDQYTAVGRIYGALARGARLVEGEES